MGRLERNGGRINLGQREYVLKDSLAALSFIGMSCCLSFSLNSTLIIILMGEMHDEMMMRLCGVILKFDIILQHKIIGGDAGYNKNQPRIQSINKANLLLFLWKNQ